VTVNTEEQTLFDTFSEESAMAIEMRRLYSRLRQKVRGTSMKSFMITSASPSEGKSTVASYLAMTVARHRRTKTVLVDADLRKSSVHKYHGIPREPGLADCLSGDKNIMDCLYDSPIDSLKIMPAGRYESAPSYLFDSNRIGEVFAELKFYFDMIIVDSPPVIPVSDPVLMVPEVDGVLLAVMAGVTPRELVIRARNVLQDVDANIMGVVVNNHAEVLPYYYGTKYYGYRDAPVPKDMPLERDAQPIPVGSPGDDSAD
jgi:capsular exopolysaccharide synthesis family protein